MEMTTTSYQQTYHRHGLICHFWRQINHLSEIINLIQLLKDSNLFLSCQCNNNTTCNQILIESPPQSIWTKVLSIRSIWIMKKRSISNFQQKITRNNFLYLISINWSNWRYLRRTCKKPTLFADEMKNSASMRKINGGGSLKTTKL